jgi:hypothetical protein
LQYFINNELNDHYPQFLEIFIPTNVFRQDHQLIFHLLNDKTRELHLNKISCRFWSNSDYSLACLLENISISAPNLEKLSFTCDSDVTLPSPFSQVKKPMQKLHSLQVVKWQWSDHDLDLMTLLVPNLVLLQVRI